MLQVVDKEDLNEMNLNKLKLVRIYCITIDVIQFFVQIGKFKKHSEDGLQYLIVF